MCDCVWVCVYACVYICVSGHYKNGKVETSMALRIQRKRKKTGESYLENRTKREVRKREKERNQMRQFKKIAWK